MEQVTTTASFTRCLPKRFDDMIHRFRGWIAGVLLAAALALQGMPLYAQPTSNVEASAEQALSAPPVSRTGTEDGLHLQYSGDSLLLSAGMRFELPELVEDALTKGIPVHFVQMVRLSAERWYWSDKVLSEVERHLRLSYQPLTRRWRLHASTEPWSERKATGIALGVSYDSLEDALAAMQRIVHWRIAERAQLPATGSLTLEVSMGIDAAQLPRPLQIGNLGRTRWSVLAVRASKVDVQTLR